eukprot:2391262-Karenia_brevis.AAC.1
MSFNGNDDDGQGDMTPSPINSEPKDNDNWTQVSNKYADIHDYPPTPSLDGSSASNEAAWS